MSRVLGALVGLVMVLFPTRSLETMQRLAVDNPDAFVARGWLASYVRVEGLLLTLVCLAGGRWYRGLVTFLGVVGALIALFPRQYLEFGNRIAYSGSDPFEWRKRYVPAVRACGAVLVLVALRALNQSDRPE